VSTQDDDAPQVIWVPTEKIEVNLALHDLLAPALEEANRAAQVDPSKPIDPHLADLLQQMSDLSKQLADVVAQIHALDPTILGQASQDQPTPS
jgi:hypothetical protein